MSKEKYQKDEKAQYLNLILLRDDLAFYDQELSKEVTDLAEWTHKMRITRYVFVSLNSVREIADSINLEGTKDYIDKTRSLKKELRFVGHFRNKAAGHLDKTLLERAVQWSPMLFSEQVRSRMDVQIAEGNKTVIEAVINSYLDEDGNQKVFGHEIDISYPPDSDEFYEYLWSLVTESTGWIDLALSILSSEIKYHNHEELREISTIAGKTDFDLKALSEFSYDKSEAYDVFENEIEEIKKSGADKKLVDSLKKLQSKYK